MESKIIEKVQNLLERDQQSVGLSDIAEEVHKLVSQPSINQEEQILLMRVTNYLCRSILIPYRSMHHELYEIAKLAPWLFDKCYAYEASKRKPWLWERPSSSFPDKADILKRVDCLFPAQKEIERPRGR
ncbi:hypothetical protein [Streptococcus sp.]|uniref:hypothetical protein n=1 Tax=Streptococcus sp. TaxID=1306 RepID=UPI00290E38BE|nr:hypothetical protein [Streptococcus sp.]MDU6445194.1 hypothetical protein [Streptococcus sp.]MDU6639099.1 hypothetical protein [Streptococcus sp.]